MVPSEYGVEFLPVAYDPKSSSISKARAFHLAFKDSKVGESPCLAASLLPTGRPWEKQVAYLGLALSLG